MARAATCGGQEQQNEILPVCSLPDSEPRGHWTRVRRVSADSTSLVFFLSAGQSSELYFPEFPLLLCSYLFSGHLIALTSQWLCAQTARMRANTIIRVSAF